ncbi:NAD(P)-dependent alcohol dehydrogenase [Lentilactobacillus buchneri]|uniref:NAD(P)-dependent alcohol dehydrogenase n=1 Tax=Lentilactobacillus buchneri TaxID=1581 RepID=UPI0010AC92D7|nr:NAD(P)-dependent alcohol dehydrogenase [Lentilactobacillus buchneri]TJY11117.1 NAD(P)-dependent alcohol dehydrogenase [Lentilactobacillus buchneri]
MKITTAVAQKQGANLTIESAELDSPKANEVLVEIKATGICHTDAAGRDYATTPYPVALGHEGAGIVKEVGSGVSTVKPGDHVVLSFSYCGHCENCLTGHPASCIHFNELNAGGRSFDGTHRIHSEGGKDISTFFGQSSFSTYSVVDEHGVTKVPSDVDISLLGPLGCGFQTGAGTVLNALKPKFGSSIAIFGTGAVGLAAMMAAKMIGMDHIIAIDIHDNRLELAKELGATETINSQKRNPEDVVKELLQTGVEYSIDTTGVSPVIKQAVHVLKPSGTCALIGLAGDVTFNIQGEVIGEAKQIIGIIEGDAIPQLFIPKLVNYYKKGLFPFDRLVKYYKFADINQAFEDSADGSVIKPIVKIGN